MSEAFDLSRDYVHLGKGPEATRVPDFEWSSEFLERYERQFEEDGPSGRLVCIIPQESTWDSWERHPAGEELVVLLDGRIDVVQKVGNVEVVVTLHPGEVVINPRNVWHRSVVHEPGRALFVTPGQGTEHRPR
jgi:quercetin dioxygenase-like cupin family protein